MNLFEFTRELLYSTWSVLLGAWMTFRNLMGWPVRSYYTMFHLTDPWAGASGRVRRVTQHYPEEKWPLAPRFRGMPTPTADPETGELYCIACLACVRICPSQIIDIQWHKPGPDEPAVTSRGKKIVKKIDKFEIDMGRCLFCALCVEVCPTDPRSIVMSKEFELSSVSRSGMWYEDRMQDGAHVLPMVPVRDSADQPETAYVNAAVTMKK
jgi:formate hydrogenlyase subunit 6/NADH:ubiquinone oxidoreductase subunit I